MDMAIPNHALRLSLKPHHQAHRRDAVTTPLLETRSIELGSGIGDRSDRIKACDANAWPWILPRLWCLDILPRRCPLGLSQGILHFYLFFSLNLWVLLWSVDYGLRERALNSLELRLSLSLSLSLYLIFSVSFWTNSLSLSIYNYSIYLPLFFFLLYLLVCHYVGLLVLVSLSFSVLWFVNLSNWLLLCEYCLLSGR